MDRGVRKAGYNDVWPMMQGSAVTGQSFKGAGPTRKLRQWLQKNPSERWEKFVYRYQRKMISKTDGRQALVPVAKMAEKMGIRGLHV